MDDPAGAGGRVVRSYLVPGSGLKMYGSVDVYDTARDAAAVEPLLRRTYGRQDIVARANVVVQFARDSTRRVRRRMVRAIAALP